MANSYNTQVLRDGYRNYVVRVTGEIQGVATTGGTDIANTMLINVANLNPPCKAIRVDRVKYSLPNGSPLDVQLLWDATTPELFWGMDSGDSGDFWNFGGLTNNAPPGWTGNILFATSGAAACTSATLYTFAVIVECVKQGVEAPL